MSKRSPKKHRRTLPALGLASVSFSMASGACAVIGHANANTPPQQTHEIFLSEEEISDVSCRRSMSPTKKIHRRYD